MAIEKDFDHNNENCVEYLTGSHYICVSFTDRKMINRVMKLYEERGEEFKYLKENQDKSICAKIPKKWLKLNAGSKEGRTMTEEQKEAAKIHLQRAREAKKKRSN